MQYIVYICDECGEEFACDSGLDFKESWEKAHDEGWVCFYLEGAWHHKCDECK